MFFPRPRGTTLRNADRIANAVNNPHPASERFDQEFPIAMQCNRCGKFAYGPRKHMRDAMKEHWETTCPARRSQADAPMEMRLLYPRVKE